MSMSWCAATPPRRGAFELPGEGVGGVVFRPSDRRLIPRCNLAAVSSCPDLVPSFPCIPQFLFSINTAIPDQNESFVGIPNSLFPIDATGPATFKRNLLTGTAQGDDVIRLWMTSEHSRRDTIVVCDASIDTKRANVTINEEATRHYRIPDGDRALQLQHCDSRVYIRTERSLKMLDDDGAIATVFDRPVSAVAFNECLPGEIVLIARDQQDIASVHCGNVGEELNAFTLPIDAQDALFSDHPRVLLATTERAIYSIDVRESNAHARLFHELPNWDRQANESGKLLATRIYSEHCIRQLHRLASRLLLVVSDRYLFVLDERAPQRALVETAHSMCRGPDYMTSLPFVNDKEQFPGNVMAVFALKHAEGVNELHLWNIFEHGEMPGQLSTIDAIRRIPAIASIHDHCRFHNAKCVRNRDVKRRTHQATRAIHLHAIDHQRAMLFRLGHDGSLWFEPFQIGACAHANRLLKRSVKKAVNWMEQIPRTEPIVRDIVDFHLAISPQMDMVRCESCHLERHLEMSGGPEQEIPETITQVDDRCLLSQLVLNCWK